MEAPNPFPAEGLSETMGKVTDSYKYSIEIKRILTVPKQDTLFKKIQVISALYTKVGLLKGKFSTFRMTLGSLESTCFRFTIHVLD